MKLASMGFTITFISTRSQLNSITQEAASFISTNKIHFVSVQDLDVKEYIQGMASKIPEIDKLLQTSEIKLNCQVCCILSDVLLLPFLGPIRNKRSNCQLVAVVVGCASFNLLSRHLGKHTDDGWINSSGLPAIIPDLSIEDIPFAIQAKIITAEFNESLIKHLEQANWIVINTFQELEGCALNALQQTYKPPVLSLGPLHIFDGIEKEEVEEDSTNNSSRVLSWLSAKQPRSVIYISFGTLAIMSVSNMQELAMGLEASNHNFLWVVRPASLLQHLPDGFAVRNGERGLVVDWAPQVQVLKHSSVGAFLTHGGWNSILEATSYGVPMLGWPQVAEQNTNCKLLADVWKLGKRINSASGKLDGTTRTVGREEIEAGIRSIMEDAISNGMLKERAVELQAEARRAVAHNGSSTRNLLHLVNALKQIA